ncbi:hypothetical protein D918_04907 [Trichuris suis]|nr:hypothetical protein D918_04907 [Trichuris suis]
MLGASKALLTIQVGNYANFVGSHWWNMQSEVNEVKGDAPDLSSFRQGDNRQGGIVLSPRVVIFEEKVNVSRLPFCSGHDLPPTGPLNIPNNEVVICRQNSFKKNEFLKDLLNGHPKARHRLADVRIKLGGHVE